MRSSARSAVSGGQCRAADRSRLANAAERQGGAVPTPVRNEKTARRAPKRRSEIEGGGDIVACEGIEAWGVLLLLGIWALSVHPIRSLLGDVTVFDSITFINVKGNIIS